MTQDNANHDAVPAATAVSTDDRTDKAAPSQCRDRPGNTPVVDRPKPICIAERLRDLADHYDNAHATTNKRTGMSIVMHEAANQIELLQSKLRLQDAVIRSGDTMLLMCSEKAAIQFMLRHAAHAADEPAFPDSADYRLHSEALYGLMERTAKWCTTKPRNGAIDTPETQSTPGECSRPQEGTSEPVAWWLRGTEYDTGCEYEYVSLLKENAEAAAAEGGTVVPLYRAPTLTDKEREAIDEAWCAIGRSDDHSEFAKKRIRAALCGLLERMR